MKPKHRSPFKARANGYRVENKADDTNFYIYDEIGWFGVSAEKLVKDINAVKSTGTIHFHINSPGGSVFDGLSIYNSIKQKKAKTVAHIDGLAASIASVIALASDEVIMAENAFFMIHDPWTVAIGSAKDLRDEADLLDKVSGSLVDTYVSNSDKTKEEIIQLMAEETWFTAAEAMEAGFVDSIYKPDEEDEKIENLFDLSIFSRVPEPLQEVRDDVTLNPKNLEKALRDAGCSRTQAKEILAKGFELHPVRDAQEDDPSPLRDAEQAEQKPVDVVDVLLNRAVAILAPSSQGN